MAAFPNRWQGGFAAAKANPPARVFASVYIRTGPRSSTRTGEELLWKSHTAIARAFGGAPSRQHH
ncbi:MAG: hypothetical protein WA734_00335, partial [Candidatus Acidiferrales bacterium]